MKHDLTRTHISWGLTAFDIPSVSNSLARFADIPEPVFSKVDIAEVGGVPLRLLDQLDDAPPIETLSTYCRVLRSDPPIVAGPVDGAFAVLAPAASSKVLNCPGGREGEVLAALRISDVMAVFPTMDGAVDYMRRLPEANQTRRQSLEERADLLASSGARRIQLARGIRRYLETVAPETDDDGLDDGGLFDG